MRPTCLYCGEPEKEEWDEYHKYYQCDCPDSVKKRSIEKQIAELERQIPKKKYEIHMVEKLVQVRET